LEMVKFNSNSKKLPRSIVFESKQLNNFAIEDSFSSMDKFHHTFLVSGLY
jgi:hypothetical protein